jgi:glucose/arabinose dehydrogenase
LDPLIIVIVINKIKYELLKNTFYRMGVRMKSRLWLIYGLLVILLNLQNPDHIMATDLTTTRVASGLSHPLFVTAPIDDANRFFIVESAGVIKIFKDGAVLPMPFLDISERVNSGGERGLLGMAFHPDYANNGYFYLNYSDSVDNTVIARFEVTSNPDIADENSEYEILYIDQPFVNHNGGMITFGLNDGYLYIGMGDGGAAGDPGNRSQDDGEMLGKILRIDVDGGSPYGIPADNPFVGPGDPLDEIWAKGLRNPWRFSFDRANGDLYIADVGQYLWEEISFQSALSIGGENYGWRLMEGAHCYNPAENCDPGGLTYPIHEYSHDSGCSITGGYVYRGNVIPDLNGTYFFADYCTDSIWSFQYSNDTFSDFQDRTVELAPGGGQYITSISSFGEDAFGELYITDFNGEVFKIIPQNPGTISGIVAPEQPLEGVEVRIVGTAIVDFTNANGEYELSGLGSGAFDVSFLYSGYIDTTVNDIVVIEGETTIFDLVLESSCNYSVGDVNNSGNLNGLDVTFSVAYFKGAPPPPYQCECTPGNIWYVSGDVNNSCDFNGLDVTYLVSFFKGGPVPIPCADCPPGGLLFANKKQVSINQ